MKHRISSANRLGYEPLSQPRESSDLAELFLATRRQAWRIALWATVGLVLGGLHYATSPREFTAVSTVLIEERQIDLDQEIAATIPTSRSDTSVLNQIQILQSLQVATEVVTTLDLTNSEAFRDTPSSYLNTQISSAKAWVRSWLSSVSELPVESDLSAEELQMRATMETATQLRSRTEFSRVGRSFAVEISQTSHDPALATAIVNAYADAYLADGTEANIEASDRMAQWMQAQIEGLRQAALDAADEVTEFRQENGAFQQQGLRERMERVDALNELLITFQTRYEEIALEGTFPVLNGRILSRALVPRNPSEPKAWQILGVGLVFGLLIGMVSAVVREGREIGFRSGSDVLHTLNLPFLGYVPRIHARKLGRIKVLADARPRTQTAPAPQVQFAPTRMVFDRTTPEPNLDVAIDAPPLTPPRDFIVSAFAPGSGPDRALRKIFTNLDAEIPSSKGQVLCVGGLTHQSGSARLASNLAHVAARTGKPTLLIDADTVGAFLSGRFGAQDMPGLIAVLDGIMPVNAAIRHVSLSRMDFLPSGLAFGQHNRVDLPDMAKYGDLIASLRSAYNYIFLCLPPLDRYPEAKSLIHQTDHLILSACWGKTPRRLLHDFLDNEPEIRRKVLGMVLNDTEIRRLKRYGVPQSVAAVAAE